MGRPLSFPPSPTPPPLPCSSDSCLLLAIFRLIPSEKNHQSHRASEIGVHPVPSLLLFYDVHLVLISISHSHLHLDGSFIVQKQVPCCDMTLART